MQNSVSSSSEGEPGFSSSPASLHHQPRVAANPAALPSSVGKDLSGDIGPVSMSACVRHTCSSAVLVGESPEPEKEARRLG